MTEVLLVRHAETVFNQQRRIQGQSESDLSEAGVIQAKALAHRLARENFSTIYTSDLKRAYQTAEHAATRTGHPITVEVRLRERHMGIFQGLTLKEIEERYPEEHRKLAQRDPVFVIPDGESTLQLQQRAVGVIEEIATRHEGKRVVVITHGGIIHTFFHHVFDLPFRSWRRLSNYNTGVNIFHRDDGQWSLGCWGDICHLTTDGADQ